MQRAHSLGIVAQLLNHCVLHLGLRVRLEIKHPPCAVTVLNQSIEPKQSPLVDELDLTALPNDLCAAPDPGALALQNSLGRLASFASLVWIEAKLAGRQTQMFRARRAPFEQAMHGQAYARQGGGRLRSLAGLGP